jgi:hypothetical protein
LAFGQRFFTESRHDSQLHAVERIVGIGGEASSDG